MAGSAAATSCGFAGGNRRPAVQHPFGEQDGRYRQQRDHAYAQNPVRSDPEDRRGEEDGKQRNLKRLGGERMAGQQEYRQGERYAEHGADSSRPHRQRREIAAGQNSADRQRRPRPRNQAEQKKQQRRQDENSAQPVPFAPAADQDRAEDRFERDDDQRYAGDARTTRSRAREAPSSPRRPSREKFREKAAPQIMRAARSVRRAKGEVSHPGRGFLRVSVVIGAPAWILFLFNILLNFEKIQ